MDAQEIDFVLISTKKQRKSSITKKRGRVIVGGGKCHRFSLLCGEKQSRVLKAKFNGFPKLCYCYATVEEELESVIPKCKIPWKIKT